MNDDLRQAFESPPARFRVIQIIHGFDGIGKDADGLGKGLDELTAAGCGGVVANVGWPGYLQDEERWRVFLLGAEETRKRGMDLWIYDEWGYPSGTAGEIVLDGHPELQARGLICLSAPVDPGQLGALHLPSAAEHWVGAVALRFDELRGRNIAERIPLPVSDRQPIEWQAPADTGPWFLYAFAQQIVSVDSRSRRPYVNLLDPRAGKRFVEVTHEEYARRMSADALAAVSAAFTDEPSLIVAYHNDPRWSRPAALPWYADLPREFAQRAGYALEPYLAELFFDIGEFEPVRCDFHRLVGELVAEGFYGAIQDWCGRHGIASSGHSECEERLSWHVCCSGDTFACLRRMDWPGMDMLTSSPERIVREWAVVIPKLVSSAAHLCRRPIVMSETSDHAERLAGGAATIAQMSGTAGLQYALGVNLITSYYGWRRDGEVADWLGSAQDPPENGYRAYCDYVARLGLMLRGGRHVCPAAVYYPVRAMQALFRPTERWYKDVYAHGERAPALDALVRDLARGMLQRQVDFDFVDDAAVLGANIEDGSLRIADESYGALILPGAQVIDREVLAKIVDFAQAGGMVVGVDSLPQRASRKLDAEAVAGLAAELGAASVEARPLEAALSQIADKVKPEVVIEPQSPHIFALHRLREDGSHVWFLTNTSGSQCALTARVEFSGDVWLCWPRTGALEHRGRAQESISLTLLPYEGVFILSG